MARTLSEIRQIIMVDSPDTMNEWLLLEKETEEAMQASTEKECDAFAESGAGEILDMTCSAVRNIVKSDICDT